MSEGTDLTKRNNSKECMICHYWFFNHGFKFLHSLCNGCHDLKMSSVNISDIAIITVKNIDVRCIIYNINKAEANLNIEGIYIYIYINIVLNFNLFKTFFLFNFFVLLYIKWLIVWTSISL